MQEVINGEEMSRYLLCLKILALEGNRFVHRSFQCNRPRVEGHTGCCGGMSFEDEEELAG